MDKQKTQKPKWERCLLSDNGHIALICLVMMGSSLFIDPISLNASATWGVVGMLNLMVAAKQAGILK